MEKLVFNDDNLKDEDMDELVIRTKAIIINDNNEILLGYCNKTYQLVGGHLEDGETIQECLKREVLEESGIDIDTSNLEPDAKTEYYTKNYHNSGLNRKNEIYYFIVRANLEPDISKMNLDEYEIEGNYTVKKVPLTEVRKVFSDTIKDNHMNEVIYSELLTIFEMLKLI